MQREADRLLVAARGSDAFVRVQGRASFRSGPALKKFAQRCAERGCRRLILDMRDCLGMDSTFMGILAGLALTWQAPDRALVLTRLSPKNCALLDTLGLTELLLGPALEAGHDPPEELTALDMETDQAESARVMLDAHETLVELVPGNLEKFRDVLDYLREDVREEEERKDREAVLS